MKQKKHFPTWKFLLLSGAFLVALSSCGGGGGILYPDPVPAPNPVPDPNPTPEPEPEPDPTPEVTTGEVTFTLDWGGLPAPPTLRFHFYPTTGAMVTKEGNASGCKATLENGTYKVLAYNKDATGVTFENTDDYNKAVVRVTTVETPARTSSVIGQPDNLYVLNMDNLTIEKGGSITPKSVVRNLSKPFALRFNIADGTVVRSIQGHLNGFLPSVSLVTGYPGNDAATAPQTEMLFDINLRGDTGSADLRCLGILDPQKGNVYSSKLLLNIVLVGGRTVSVEVDLSTAISDILAKNSGMLPDDKPTKIEIKLESQANIRFVATVIGWSVGDTLDGEIK